MSVRVHIFLVRGGMPVAFQAPGNAQVRHDGQVSLWSLVLTPEGARVVEGILTRVGAIVTVTSEGENEEQAELRDALLELDTEALPTAACATCFWLDPAVEGFCGRTGWETSFRDLALQASPKAVADAEACPLGDQQ